MFGWTYYLVQNSANGKGVKVSASKLGLGCLKYVIFLRKKVLMEKLPMNFFRLSLNDFFFSYILFLSSE